MAEIPWQVVRLVGPIVLMGPPVAFYVYRERAREEEPHPFAWAIGVGLLGGDGLLLYLQWRGNLAPD